MSLFDRSNDEFRPDLGSQALSVIAIENKFVEGTYEKLAKFYDVMFGPILHPGRLLALERMGIAPGNRVLEVGVGTGINTPLYPRNCRVTGIDLSTPMLDKARTRVARKGLSHVRLMEMDAAHLKFPDETFDIVYAPYLVNCVSDPIGVVNEMKRVCKRGGKIVIVNHFRNTNPVLSRLDRWLSPLTVHIGFKADLDLPGFIKQAGLNPISIEKVMPTRLWTLVICAKD
jgi:phosphatidylethanolamine/phosphatidyl-N-methylethanolamine N-methyltransferase